MVAEILRRFMLGALVLLMTAGVAVWGINDILTGGNDKTVAKVGNNKIGEIELEETVQNNRQRLMQSGFTSIPEEMRAMLRNNALVNLISDRLLQNEFRKLNLQIDGKEVLKKDYLSSPDVDKARLQALIASYGGERIFLARIVNEKKIDIVQGSLTAITPVTDMAVNSAYGFDHQTRSIEYVQLEPSVVKDVAEPTEQELQEFYKTNSDAFLMPEFRDVSYITINEKMLENQSGDGDIATQLHNLTGEILDRVAGGETLEEIAADHSMQVKKAGPMNKNGMTPEAAQATIPSIEGFLAATFLTENQEVSDVLESADGKSYMLLRVDNVTEERIRPLDEVRGEVTSTWKEQQRYIKLNDLAKNAKKELDEGKTSLEKIAAATGTQIRSKNGIKPGSNIFSPELAKQVFTLRNGSTTDVIRAQDGSLIIARLTGIEKAGNAEAMKMFEYKSKVQEQYSQEIMAQYLDYLRNKYGVTVY